MAAGDITYGTRTALADVDRINSNGDGTSEAFAEIDNSSAGAVAYSFYLEVPIHASATTAVTYKVYLLESQDGADWTDGIDPATSGDVEAKRQDAELIAVTQCQYDATNRTLARIHFSVYMAGRAQYIGLLFQNNSGQTVPASPAADGYSVSHKVS